MPAGPDVRHGTFGKCTRSSKLGAPFKVKTFIETRFYTQNNRFSPEIEVK